MNGCSFLELVFIGALVGACDEPAPAAAPEPTPEPAVEAAQAPAAEPAGNVTWRELEPGLELAGIHLPVPSFVGDSVLRVVRVDPARWTLSLQMASATGGRLRTAQGWLETTGGVAAINAAMFGQDYSQGVGWMSSGEHINQGRWAPDQNSLLAFDPVSVADPAVHLYNLGCASRTEAEARYRTRVQSIRMLGCAGENVWSEQPKVWSAALVGQDRAGRVLLLHVRSPYSMHALVDQLRALPLDLVALHYGEGGPEATLAIRTARARDTWVGSWETGFYERDDNHLESELPNMIVVRRR